MKTISFVNICSGTGKTTTVLGVGSGLAEIGKKTLLVDLDWQMGLTSIVSPFPVTIRKGTVFDALQGRKDDLIKPLSDNLDYIASEIGLALYNGNYFPKMPSVLCLRKFLKDVGRDYDYILIDTPSSCGYLYDASIVASNYVIMVTTGSEAAYKGLCLAADTIDFCCDSWGLPKAVEMLGILVTRYRNTRACGSVVRSASKDYKGLLLRPIIREEAIIGKCALKGENFMEVAPDSKTAIAYEDLAKTVMFLTER